MTNPNASFPLDHNKRRQVILTNYWNYPALRKNYFDFSLKKYPEHAPIISEKVLYCAIVCKRLYCRNGILKNEQVPELYGNHLEGETGVVFHTKNADTIDPGNIVVQVNETAILICNIHHMDSDVWYDSGHNYDNRRQCINIKKLVMFKMFLHYQVYMLSLEMITHLRFLEREKLNLCRLPLKKKNLPMYLVN